MTAKLGPEHPETRLLNQNVTYLRNLTTAPERYRAELAKYGTDHPKTLLAHRDVAQLYITMNRLDDAERILVELIGRMSHRADDDSVRVYTVGLLGTCRGIREASEPDAWTTFNTKSVFGGALLGQKKYARAERPLLDGYKGLKEREQRIPPASRARLDEALDRLIELSIATNKPDDVKKWQAERAKYHLNPAPAKK
jgi:hypothetical protein